MSSSTSSGCTVTSCGRERLRHPSVRGNHTSIHPSAQKYGILGSSSMIMTGAPTTSKDSGLANNPSVVRSGHLDSVLALGVRGGECLQGLAGLIEAIGVLDGHPED